MVEFEEVQSCYNNENKLCRSHYWYSCGVGYCSLTLEPVKPENCFKSHKRYVLISKVVKK